MSNAHQRITQEIESLGGYKTFYNAAARTKNPNGLHRLAHLVPEVAPDQESLARILAEYAIGNRGDDYTDPISFEAYRQYESIKGDDRAIRRLAARAPRDGVAWQTCQLFLEPPGYAEIRRRMNQERKPLEKRIGLIPEPIQNLMERHFLGEVERPHHSDNILRNHSIVFAVRLTLEADIKATSGNPNACLIVGEQLGISDKTIRDLWQQRGERPERGRQYR